MFGSGSHCWQQNVFGVEHLPWDNGVEFHQQRKKIEVAFQPLPMADIMASMKAVHNKPDKVPSKEKASKEPHPTFRPCSNTQMTNFNLKKKSSRVTSIHTQPGRHSFRKKNTRPNLLT